MSTRVCAGRRSEEHTSELQSRRDLVCRLLLEKKKKFKPLSLSSSNGTCSSSTTEQKQHRSRTSPRCVFCDMPTTGVRIRVFYFFFFKESGTPQVLPLSPPRPSPD